MTARRAAIPESEWPDFTLPTLGKHGLRRMTADEQQQVHAHRAAIAQELYAIGYSQPKIRAQLHCDTGAVPRYLHPEREPDRSFPRPWLLFDPSPATGEPVMYDEWSQPIRDANEICVRLALHSLLCQGLLVVTRDVAGHASYYHAKDRLTKILVLVRDTVAEMTVPLPPDEPVTEPVNSEPPNQRLEPPDVTCPPPPAACACRCHRGQGVHFNRPCICRGGESYRP